MRCIPNCVAFSRRFSPPLRCFMLTLLLEFKARLMEDFGEINSPNSKYLSKNQMYFGEYCILASIEGSDQVYRAGVLQGPAHAPTVAMGVGGGEAGESVAVDRGRCIRSHCIVEMLRLPPQPRTKKRKQKK